MLLSLLPKSYSSSKDTLLYRRESPTLNEIRCCKELNCKNQDKVGHVGECLNIKGKYELHNFRGK